MKNSLIAAFLILSFLPFSAMGETTTYEVTGKLIDEDGFPVEGQTLLLYDAVNTELASEVTNRQGEFLLSYEGIPSSAEFNPDHKRPSAFRLGATYPNPFNPRTTVPFEAPVDTRATISLYNMLGQEIIQTVSNIRQGMNEIEINLAGNLSQGRYLLRVQGEGFSEVTTMTFVSAGISGGTMGIRVHGGGRMSGESLKNTVESQGSVEYMSVVVVEKEPFQRKEIEISAHQNVNMGTITLSFVEADLLIDIDNNVYETVEIGTQEWMAENLRTTRYVNGDTIPNVPNDTEWLELYDTETGGWVYYDNNPTNGQTYGKLYNWFTVMDERGLCPEGWRVPDGDDWETLWEYLGGHEVAGKKMKTTHGWIDNGNGTNESGFSGLPGGYRSGINARFSSILAYGKFWSTKPHEEWERSAYRALLNTDYDWLFFHGKRKASGYSVRCLKE